MRPELTEDKQLVWWIHIREFDPPFYYRNPKGVDLWMSLSNKYGSELNLRKSRTGRRLDAQQLKISFDETFDEESGKTTYQHRIHLVGLKPDEVYQLSVLERRGKTINVVAQIHFR